jgi:hypothetical protein
LIVQFKVGTTVTIPISEGISYEELPQSNICFTADTPVTTDQGNIQISRIQPGIHTIHKKPIVAITKTFHDDKYLICFEKDALYPNVPSQRTLMTKNHGVFYKGWFIPAHYFIQKNGVSQVEHKEQEPLYNVLMEEKEAMLVNSLICETLSPLNKIVPLFTEKAYLEEYVYP